MSHDWSRAREIGSGPHPGFYKVRLRPYCPWVAMRIWLDWPRDDEGRLADRPRRLACQINGEWACPWEHWERAFPCSEDEYRNLLLNPPADPWARVVRTKRHGDQHCGAEGREGEGAHPIGQVPI